MINWIAGQVKDLTKMGVFVIYTLALFVGGFVVGAFAIASMIV